MARPYAEFRQLPWASLSLLLFALCLLQAWTACQAPPRHWPRQIIISLARGESLILGQRELAAAQADRQHISLSRGMQGEWHMQNISANKQLLLQTTGQERYLRKTDAPYTLSTTERGLVLGHSGYKLSLQGEHLLLEPNRRVTLFGQREQALSPAVHWQWQTEAHWQMPFNGFSALLLASALLLFWAQRHPAWQPLPAALLAAGGLWALLSAPTLAQAMAVSTLAALLMLSLPGKRSPGMALAMCLLALGLLSQLELGLGGMESIWTGYFLKSCALQALALGLAGIASARKRPLPYLPAVEAVLLALACLALLCMALEVLFGSETGVFGMQPVELAKPALIAISAHVLALCHGQTLPRRAMAWRWLWPVVLLAAFVSLALVQVSDYSPLLLLLIWAGTSALAWTWLTGRHPLAYTLLVPLLTAPLMIFVLRTGSPDWLPAPGQFYAERFQVWLQPGLHPHTGQQFLQGAQAIAAGGWLGADQHLGLPTLGMPLGSLMRIPAIQDDFALAFFLNRHGLLAALLLWLMQAGFLTCLLLRAARAWRYAQQLRDYRLAWHARFYGLALIGAAGFLFGQLLLSWGTNLGILPVMGQPMSFLSSGGSHLLFFLLPLLGFYILYAPSFEE